MLGKLINILTLLKIYFSLYCFVLLNEGYSQHQEFLVKVKYKEGFYYRGKVRTVSLLYHLTSGLTILRAFPKHGSWHRNLCGRYNVCCAKLCNGFFNRCIHSMWQEAFCFVLLLEWLKLTLSLLSSNEEDFPMA